MNYIPQANSVLAIALYWLPMGVCLFGYLRRSVKNYRQDVALRSEADTKPNGYYSPTDTIGTLIGRTIVAVMPVGNLIASLFDLAPELLGRFFEWIGRVFSKPLVPKRSKQP